MALLFRIHAALSLTLTAFSCIAADTNIVAEVSGRFQPTKPSVVMSYDVTYALLHIRLKRIAGATLTATEGVWHGGQSAAGIPACLIDFHVASPRTGADAGWGDVNLSKRTVSVLALPELRIVTYAKQNDEFIKPFFRQGRRMKYVEVYNFESGALAYRRHDLVTGLVETNLPGMADLAKQSTEVADVLQALYAAYRDDPTAERRGANQVHFNVDGVVRTFALRMTKGRTTASVLSRKIPALYADIQPEATDAGRNESFSMWCVPFRDFSRETQDMELRRLGETSLECSMLPLSGEYGLFLGSMQCTLTNICTQSAVGPGLSRP